MFACEHSRYEQHVFLIKRRFECALLYRLLRALMKDRRAGTTTRGTFIAAHSRPKIVKPTHRQTHTHTDPALCSSMLDGRAGVVKLTCSHILKCAARACSSRCINIYLVHYRYVRTQNRTCIMYTVRPLRCIEYEYRIYKRGGQKLVAGVLDGKHELYKVCASWLFYLQTED